MDFEPTEEMYAKVGAAALIFKPKVETYDPEMQEMMRNTPEEHRVAQQERFAQAAGETGIMNKEQFFQWQLTEDKRLLEGLGKGMGWTVEESAVVYDGFNSMSPEYDGVKSDDLAKFRLASKKLKEKAAAAQ